MLYSGGPHKLTKDSTLAVGENGFIYVAADTNSDPFYERFINKVIVGKKLLLRKYNSQKNEIWLNQMGSLSINFDVAGIAVDSKGNTYITGSKSSSVNELDSDLNKYLFLFKVNSQIGSKKRGRLEESTKLILEKSPQIYSKIIILSELQADLLEAAAQDTETILSSSLIQTEIRSG
ncbi:beta-propeller repeat protein [Leptospira noguchii str. 1993005606]|uniref:Beta-propeller repeat protein n=1 Tax=Leptospira noguchii str. 2001034031 TaxID=1193053 RepID=M6YXZ0_9LEPT|nr:beta-propeller repeat protein [Leptospira noguchii str. 2001034031]EPE84775.1 beta-propeller repeat protein [Leptospira noguchii str. 1993005606]